MRLEAGPSHEPPLTLKLEAGPFLKHVSSGEGRPLDHEVPPREGGYMGEGRSLDHEVPPREGGYMGETEGRGPVP